MESYSDWISKIRKANSMPFEEFRRDTGLKLTDFIPFFGEIKYHNRIEKYIFTDHSKVVGESRRLKRNEDILKSYNEIVGITLGAAAFYYYINQTR